MPIRRDGYTASCLLADQAFLRYEGTQVVVHGVLACRSGSLTCMACMPSFMPSALFALRVVCLCARDGIGCVMSRCAHCTPSVLLLYGGCVLFIPASPGVCEATLFVVYEAILRGSMHGGPMAVARLHGVLAWRPVPCLRGCAVWQQARWALGCCEAARCVYESVLCGNMHDGPMAVVRLHGVLAWRAVPCLRGHTVWQHALRAHGCCEAARCASMASGPLFTRPYCVAAHGCCEVARCASMASGPLFTRPYCVAACTGGPWLLRGCTVCLHGVRPLAVARLHCVLAWRPALGCCEAARCGSMHGEPLFTMPYCVAAVSAGPWLL
jgi:hypothetical protein